MKILSENNENPTNVALILGFFDGVHLGHREVINQAVDYAKENASKTVLITFKSSPAEYFQKQFEYIFEREYSYEIMDALGVDYLYECEFSDLVNIPAQQYRNFYHFLAILPQDEESAFCPQPLKCCKSLPSS